VGNSCAFRVGKKKIAAGRRRNLFSEKGNIQGGDLAKLFAWERNLLNTSLRKGLLGKAEMGEELIRGPKQSGK